MYSDFFFKVQIKFSWFWNILEAYQEMSLYISGNYMCYSLFSLFPNGCE